MELKDIIARELNIPLELIDEAVKIARRSVKKFHLPKRSGGYRVISQPDAKTKAIQYWLIHNIFEKLPIHEVSMAYKKRISTLDNALAHKKNKYFLKVDLKDFFPSIKFADLDGIIKEWHKEAKTTWSYNKSAKLIINNTCFDAAGKLPIGYPSSPSISNAVMHSFDTKLNALLADKDEFGDIVYTRYADDIIVSTNKRQTCKSILSLVRSTIKEHKHPSIIINESKMQMCSSTSGSAVVTGLRICENEHITINRKQKDNTRLLLSLLAKKQLRLEDYKILRGHLAYIKHVDPQFYTKLQTKYFEEIESLLTLPRC